MEQEVSGRNVLLLKPKDIIRRDGQVYAGTLSELSQLRKTEQFKTGVVFPGNMSGEDVQRRLEEAFPDFKNKR